MDSKLYKYCTWYGNTLVTVGQLRHTKLYLGPFLVPLNSASAPQAILSDLCPSNNPPQIVLASRESARTPGPVSDVTFAKPYTLSTTNYCRCSSFVRQHHGSYLKYCRKNTRLQCSIPDQCSLISDSAVELSTSRSQIREFLIL
jgi:hypothetical protein